MADIYLVDTDDSVAEDSKIGYDSGSVKSIYLQATGIDYDVGVYTQTADQPGKPSTTSFKDRLSYGDSLGFSNPKITIRGVINLDNYDESTGAEPTLDNGLIINLKYLQQIFKSGHEFTLYDYFDADTTTPIYRIHSLDSDDNITPPQVKCTGMSVQSNTQVKEGAKIVYSIELVEVRSG